MSNSKISHDDLLSIIDEADNGGTDMTARAITALCRYFDLTEGETLLAISRVIAHIVGDNEESLIAVALLVRMYAQSCSGSYTSCKGSNMLN